MFTITRRSLLLGATALTAAGLAPIRSSYAQANRTYHALLVAVTKYPHLPEKAWLVGPNHDAVLVRDLRAALVQLNPQLPALAIEAAITTLTHHDFSRSLVQHNRAFHALLRDGVAARAEPESANAKATAMPAGRKPKLTEEWASR